MPTEERTTEGSLVVSVDLTSVRDCSSSPPPWPLQFISALTIHPRADCLAQRNSGSESRGVPEDSARTHPAGLAFLTVDPEALMAAGRDSGAHHGLPYDTALAAEPAH